MYSYTCLLHRMSHERSAKTLETSGHAEDQQLYLRATSVTTSPPETQLCLVKIPTPRHPPCPTSPQTTAEAKTILAPTLSKTRLSFKSASFKNSSQVGPRMVGDKHVAFDVHAMYSLSFSSHFRPQIIASRDRRRR